MKISAEQVPIALENNLHNVISLEAGQPAYRVLIVEDQLENWLLLKTLLLSIGFNVYEAHNEKESVELFQQVQPLFTKWTRGEDCRGHCVCFLRTTARVLLFHELAAAVTELDIETMQYFD